jgi:hypothetical protein
MGKLPLVLIIWAMEIEIFTGRINAYVAAAFCGKNVDLPPTFDGVHYFRELFTFGDKK